MTPGYVEFTSQQPDDGVRVTVRMRVDSDIGQRVEEFRNWLLACGFAPKLVEDYMGEAQ